MQRILTSRLKDIDLFAAGVSHNFSTRLETTERMAQQVIAGERGGRGEGWWEGGREGGREGELREKRRKEKGLEREGERW